MKPTDEAKRLRDEIAEIIRESDCGAPIERYYDDADESINKVLDAVVQTMLDEAESINISTVRGEGLYDGAARSIRTIRKLRP